MLEGWKCPVCGKVNAPLIPSCNCHKRVHPLYPYKPWKDNDYNILPHKYVYTGDPILVSWKIVSK